jgi:hypothetical protein
VPRPAPARDGLTSFALSGESANVGVVHVNALFNTPLFERLRQCMPEEFAQIEAGGAGLGVDLTRDLDRVAITSSGVAMSGFFEGKPVAAAIAGSSARSEDYRGATLFSRPSGCVAQSGNLVLMGRGDDCRPLVDAALTPAPPDAQDTIYGDVFFRTDLSALRGQGAPDELRALVDGLSGVTVRANVWDSVALTVEGTPAAGQNVRDLEQMARGAIALVKSQLDDDQVEVRALADLAKVGRDAHVLQVDLALPAQDLFDKLHFPCPGRGEGKGQGRGKGEGRGE